MSDEKQETVADIVAFIGKCLDLIDTELTRMSNKEHAMSADALLCPVLNAKAALDRIGAAWKRERAEVEADALSVGGIVEAARTAEKSSAVGNAAAMREALVSVRNWCINKLGGASIQVRVEGLLSIVEDALSAPARNCDMYLTQPEMSRAYEEYRDAAMKRYGNGLTGRVPTVKQKPMTYDEWLIAPAAERKGEGDGR